jgi:copper oxidase (laccase) domain-containing protein
MDMIQIKSLTALRFRNLSRFPELRHGVFTRDGGAGQGPFRGLNLAGGVGDDPDAVSANRRAVAEAMGHGRLRRPG